MMRYLFISFLISNAFITFVSSTSQEGAYKQKLIDLGKQLNRIELQLNTSVNQILQKFDTNNQRILNSIKSFRYSQFNSLYFYLFEQEKHNILFLEDHGIRPVTALLIIDVQIDFINGTLALRDCPSKHNGEEVVPVINQLVDNFNFDVIVYSHDWHPTDHISFFDNLSLRSKLLANDSTPLEDLHLYSKAIFSLNTTLNMEQTLWPRHCVQNSFGAQLHPDLEVVNTTNNRTVIHIQKGTKPDIDSYSAFWDNLKLSETSLNKQLKKLGVTHVFLTGIATDWCVYSTGIHALEYGYETFLIEDACRGVDENTIKENLQIFQDKNGHVIQSNEVKNYV